MCLKQFIVFKCIIISILYCSCYVTLETTLDIYDKPIYLEQPPKKTTLSFVNTHNTLLK